MSSFSFPRMLLVRQNFPDRRIPDIAGEVGASLRPRLLRRNYGLEPAWQSASAAAESTTLQPSCALPSATGSRMACTHSLFRRWEATERLPPKDRPMCWRTTAWTNRTWGVPSSASWKWCRWARRRQHRSLHGSRRLRGGWRHVVNRTKWHTDFSGKIESGLFKMMAIGLGKFAGARRYHMYGYKLGLEHVIRSVGRWCWTRARSWEAWRFSRTPITTRQSSMRLLPATWSNARRRTWNWRGPGWEQFRRSRHPRHRRDRQAHQRRRHGLESREPRLGAERNPYPFVHASSASSFAISAP